ncbi:hypothetical protein H1P_6800004 [Hyella patelloides LEGE 07179]|uniref:Uncharacterized protein n=1 Tax=Hyella patelloides LEGE 07179 TaxID=945734 RepID=A0A563W3E5_9CYAN|nr:hypothetical protein H1P_6800004 [Hyella patelloides LEGE 07179]
MFVCIHNFMSDLTYLQLYKLTIRERKFLKTSSKLKNLPTLKKIVRLISSL